MKLIKFDLNLVWLILILTCIVFILNLYRNTKTNSCFINQRSLTHKLIIRLITLIHIGIVVFSIFGWLFFNKKLLLVYLIVQLCLILHWITNDWKCKLSQFVNKICNYDDSLLFFDDSLLLEELLKYIGITKKIKLLSDNTAYIMMFLYIVCMFIAFYKLQKGK